MESVLFVAPLAPGKLERYREIMKEIEEPARADFRAFLNKGGVSRLRVWAQPSPQGDVVVVLQEGPDPKRLLTTAAESTEPAAAWFREWVAEVHGMKFDEGPPPLPEFVADIEIE